MFAPTAFDGELPFDAVPGRRDGQRQCPVGGRSRIAGHRHGNQFLFLPRRELDDSLRRAVRRLAASRTYRIDHASAGIGADGRVPIPGALKSE
jgi:hypothetical protein